MVVLDEIPADLKLDRLMKSLHIKPESTHAARLQELIAEWTLRMRPKAVYDVGYIERKDGDSVTVNGVTFTSRVLRTNLGTAERIFPYVATCGGELDEIGQSLDDFLEQFWLDAIKGALLNCATRFLHHHLNVKFALGHTSTMGPGSAGMEIWPIQQQRQLFSLFGDVEELIGVKLTPSYLMVPNKSVSGFRFPTEISYKSCQVCQREKCPSRAAPFDQALWESYGFQKERDDHRNH